MDPERKAEEFRRFFERSRRVLDLELRGPGASPR